MKITEEKVHHIALLARLEISEAEVSEYQDHLQKVLDHMEELKEVNTDGVEPFFSPSFHTEMPLREDKVKKPWTPEDVVKNAPRQKQNQFVVDAVIDDE